MIKMDHNIIVHRLPDTIEVSGTERRINTSYRIWLMVDDIVRSGIHYGDDDKIYQIISLAYKENQINHLDPEEAVSSVIAAIKFLHDCSKQTSGTNPKYKSKESGKSITDIGIDQGRLYAAFLQAYGIDLCKTDMHWLQFCALLQAMPDTTMYSKVCTIRATDISKLTGESRASMIDAQNLYKIERIDEREDKISALIDEILRTDGNMERLPAMLAELEKTDG